LRDHESGAQRASFHRWLRPLALPFLAAVIAVSGLVALPPTTATAASVKVVIIVGPVGSSTAKYKSSAKRYAAQARALGATVKEIYSPNATWAKVKAAAVGANIIIYLGHGNGYPSPYGAFYADRKDGFGLNKAAGHGNSNTKYYGEKYVKTLPVAKNAVVILNRLCYASGNSEWGSANPTTTTARKRVDNYGAGFLRSGARAVFASGIDSVASVIKGLLVTNKTMGEIFQTDPAWTGTRDFKFASSRTPGYAAWMDPYQASRFYHSVVGKLDLTASAVRAGG